MKSKIFALLLSTAALTAPGLAFADADDIKWVAKCMTDNAKEGKSETIVRKYCECMNSKMGDDETQSITQWEKSHPKEEAECSKKAGWK